MKQRPYKILLTGTLRSGKTTFLKSFEGRPGFTVIREVAQDLIDEHGYHITQNPEFEDMIFSEQLSREAAAEAAGQSFILCDRGVLDNIAFARLIGFPIKPEWWDYTRNQYDLAVVFNKDDIAFDPSEYEGDVTFDMVAYRDRADRLIREVVAEAGLPTIPIQGNPEERVADFEDYIRRRSLQEGNRYFSRSKES